MGNGQSQLSGQPQQAQNPTQNLFQAQDQRPTALATAQPVGGSGVGHAGSLFRMNTGGFGTMPESATPLSQAMQGGVSNRRWRNLQMAGMTDPGADYGENMAASENIRQQGAQEEFGRRMQDQQMQSAMMRNQAMQKLLGLFGGAGGGENPAEGFLKGIREGGVQGLASSPLMQELLKGTQAQTNMAFEPQERALQQKQGAQGRYGLSSTAAFDEQSRLAGRKAQAGQAGYGQAWQGTLAGLDPMMKSAGLTTQFAQSQQGQLPQMFSALMRG